MGKYSDLFDEGKDNQASFNIRFGIESKPDDEAQKAALAKRYGLPIGVISEYKPDYEVRAKTDDARAIVDQSPKLRGWLAKDPMNAKLTHDDLQNLADQERTVGGFVRDALTTAIKGTIAVPQAAVGIADIPTFGYAGKAVQALGIDFKRSQDILAGKEGDTLISYSGAQQRANAEVDNAEGFFGTIEAMLRNPSTIATNVGESLPLMGAGGLVGRGLLKIAPKMAPWLSAALGEGVVGAGSAAEQIRSESDDGLLSLKQNFASVMSGVGTAAFGAAGGKAAQKMGLADIDTLLVKGGMEAADATKVKDGFIKAFVKAGVSEGAFEEMPQSIQEQMWQNFANDRPIMEGVDKAAAIALVTGATTGGAVESAHRTINRMGREEQKATIGENHAQILSDIQKTMEASKVMERSPETLQAYMQDLLEDTGADKVFIDSKKLVEAGLDLTALAQAVPSIASQLDQVEVGGDIVIPTSELLTNTIGTEFAQPLIDNARTDPNGYSRVEAQQFMAEKGDKINEQIDRALEEKAGDMQFQQSKQDVEDALLEKMNAAAVHGQKANKTLAKFMSSFFATLAAKRQMMPMQVAEKFLLDFSNRTLTDATYDQDGQLVTDSENFRNWFGDSKVVSAEGKPLVVYHGTGADITEFSRETAGSTTGAKNASAGFFFSDRADIAGRYADMARGDANIMPVYLSIKNPLRIQAANMMEADKMLLDQLTDEHDGAIVEVKSERGNQTVYMARNQTQIKSSIGNNGQFDPNNPNIMMQSYNQSAVALEQSIEQAGGDVTDTMQIDQLIDSKDIPVITLNDLIGKSIFPTIADRTAAAALYTGIDSSGLQVAVPLLGGPFFPLRQSNVQAGVVWANRGKGVTSQKAAKLKDGANYMMVVMGDADMHQSNSTVAAAFMGTLDAWVRDGRISPENVQKLGDLVREIGAATKVNTENKNAQKAAKTKEYLENFPGFDDPEIMHAYMDGISFDARKRILEIMASKQALELGAPPMARILEATREPSLAGHRWGDGVLLVEVDQQNPQVELGTEGTTHHPDFPVGIRGKVVGKLNAPINWQLLWQDWLAENSDKDSPRRAFELAKPVVNVTQDLVDRIGEIKQENIDSARQARLAADFAAGNWSTSDNPVNKGGVSPQEFLDAIANSAAKTVLSEYTLDEVKKGIKSGSMKIFQLGADGQIFFALKKGDPGYAADYKVDIPEIGKDEVTLTAVINNEAGARGIGGPAVVLKALQEGATVLDAFAVKSKNYPNGFLPSLYAAFGFEVVKEIPFDPQYYTTQKLADAVKFWQESTKGYDPDVHGYPPLVIMKWKGTDADRAAIIERYLSSGLEGLLEGGTRADVQAAAAEFDAPDSQEAGQSSGADTGRAAGDQGSGAAGSVASRARGTVQGIANLSDAELKNLGLTPEDRAAVRKALGLDGSSYNQPAYHGTPHRGIDKFSTDKIGTGEGAQAYGWGLYFASKRDVAEYYRETLTNRDMQGYASAHLNAKNLLARLNGDVDWAAETLKDQIHNTEASDPNYKRLVDTLRLIESGDYAKPLENQGQLYEVDIPEDDTMLLWDKPLSEQPELVRNALKRRMPDPAPFDGMDMGSNARLRDNRDGQFKDIVQPWVLEASSGNGVSRYGLTEKDVERMVGASDNNDLTGQQIYSRFVASKGSQKAASEALAAAGIKGIKYLDGTSRSAGEGSYNYVVFSGDDVAIKNQFYQAARGQISFAQDITKQASIISAMSGADLSTFIHEGGHFFMEVQAYVAAEIAGQIARGEQISAGEQSILDDFNKTMDWFGIKATPEMSQIDVWAMMSIEEKRPYHEMFARGWEAYAFEGKAPSEELRSVFQTFRSWLLNVYKSLLKSMSASSSDIGEALDVELTDEVRAVFDRMIATTEQIKDAEASRNMGPLFASFDDAKKAGISLPEYEAYHKLATSATHRAIDELQARGLRDMQWLSNARGRKLKEMQKKHDLLRWKIKNEVASEVMSQPVYLAWQFLTATTGTAIVGEKPTGKSKSLNPAEDNLFTAIAKLGGLDRESVKKAWGIDEKEKMESGVFGMPVVRKTGGLSIDAMAEQLLEMGYLLPDAYGSADMDKFEELFDDQRRGVDRYSIQRDMEKAYGEKEVKIPEVPMDGRGKLRTEDLRRMYGTKEDAIWRKLSERRMTSDDGGLDADVVAAMFGFDSGDALVKALVAAEDPKTVIDNYTDMRMLQDHGDIATPAGLQAAVDAALHNDARIRFVATELKALNAAMAVRQKVEGRKMSEDVLVRAAKDVAKQTISRLKVRDLRPAQYAAAAARAGAQAEKSRADIPKALEAKRNQLINMHAAKEAQKALDEIESAIEYFKRVVKPGSIPAQHHNQILNLLEKFDLHKSTSLETLDNRASFKTWVIGQLNQGMVPPNVEALLSKQALAQYEAQLMQRDEETGELIYSEEEEQAKLLASYIDSAAIRHYKDVSVEEILGLRDTIKQIEHIGRRTKKVLTDRKNREFAAVITRMRQQIEDVAEKMGRKAGDTRTPNDKTGQGRLSWRGFFFSHVKAANLLHIMDGGHGGPLWEHLMSTANDAANGEVEDLAKAHDHVQGLLKTLKGIGDITDKPMMFPSIGRSLNRQARIVMAMNMGNSSNMQRLLGGEGWTLQQIKPVLDTLTAADWNFVQSMWDYYETFRPRVGAMESELHGAEPEWIEARALEVETADGQRLKLRGGYAPVIFDPRASGKAASHAAEKDAKAMMQAARVASTVSKSFTKARVEEVHKRPLLLSLDAMIGGIQDTIHYLHWQPWIIDANRMLKALDEPIRTYYGAEVVKQLREWAADNAAGVRPARDAAERKVTELARNVSYAGLAFNVLSAVKQVTGYTQSVVVVGGKWMGRGLARSIASPRGAYLDAVEKSSFMRKRASTRMRDLAETKNTIQDQGKIREFLDTGGYAMMLAMQTAVDVPTWWAGYERAIDAGLDEDMAVAQADQAVIDAQGSGLQKDLASVERATGAIRLLTGFMSFMNTTMNVNYRVLKSDQSVGAKAVDLILVNSLPVLIGSLISMALVPGGGDDEEPEDIAKKLAADQLGFILGQMVGIREIQQIGYAAMGMPQGDYGGSVGTRMFADLLKLAKQVGQGDMDDSLRKAIVNAAGDFFRLPSAQINKTWTGVEAVLDGETEGAQSVAAPVFGFSKQ